MSASDSERDLARLVHQATTLLDVVQGRFHGQRDVVVDLVVAILSGGHVLLEGAPGLGKTTLVRALAESLSLSFQRVQCTPDLMPADILGTRILEEEERGARRFRFEKGPVFTHVLLADEVNRATPRTQSALLEAMAEHQVTIFGETRTLEEPFFVVATQNPIEMEGTYPLPEAQLDRFQLKLLVATPTLEELVTILDRTTSVAPAVSSAAMSRADLLSFARLVREVPVSPRLVEIAARSVLATQPASEFAPDSVRSFVRVGASPRAAQSLLLAAKAHALLNGRVHVADEDVSRFVAPAFRHRLILNYEGEAARVSTDELARAAFERAGRDARA